MWASAVWIALGATVSRVSTRTTRYTLPTAFNHFVVQCSRVLHITPNPAQSFFTVTPPLPDASFCVSSFPVAAIKYCDQRVSIEGRVHFVPQLSRESPCQGRRGDRQREQEAVWSHFLYTQQSERTNRQWDGAMNSPSLHQGGTGHQLGTKCPDSFSFRRLHPFSCCSSGVVSEKWQKWGKYWIHRPQVRPFHLYVSPWSSVFRAPSFSSSFLCNNITSICVCVCVSFSLQESLFSPTSQYVSQFFFINSFLF